MVIIDDVKDLTIEKLDAAAVIFSKTSIGFSSPQIASIANSLADFLHSPVIVLAPLGRELPARDFVDAGYHNTNLRLIYVDTRKCANFREVTEKCIEFAGALLQKIHPELILSFDLAILMTLKNLTYAPKAVVAYLLELPPADPSADTVMYFYGTYESAAEIGHLLDLVIFPEKNRARLIMNRLAPKGEPKVEILYNSNFFPWKIEPVPAAERDAAFFYGGGIRKYQTRGTWFHEPEVQKFPINLYGWTREFEDPEAAVAAFNGHPYRQRYHGMLPTDAEYYSILSRHAFSLVLWAPVQEDALYACPNKLFDALSCGVPFISGPNPLMKELSGKYRCGIIMPDWELPTFLETLKRALGIFGTPEYDRMVEGCVQAMRQECDWNTQFQRKIVPHLERLLRKH